MITMARKCKNCGEVLEDDSLFCGKCGSYVKRSKKTGSYPVKWIVVALIAISLILAAGIFITNHNTKMETSLTMLSDSHLGSSDEFSIQLKDKNSTPLSDRYITVEINNETYTLRTDSNGTARINLTLSDGSYEIKSFYKENDKYLESHSSDIIVK